MSAANTKWLSHITWLKQTANPSIMCQKSLLSTCDLMHHIQPLDLNSSLVKQYYLYIGHRTHLCWGMPAIITWQDGNGRDDDSWWWDNGTFAFGVARHLWYYYWIRTYWGQLFSICKEYKIHATVSITKHWNETCFKIVLMHCHDNDTGQGLGRWHKLMWMKCCVVVGQNHN